MRAAAIIIGCLLILITLQDAFEVVLLPRRVSRRFRFTTLFFRTGWGLWRILGAPSAPRPRAKACAAMSPGRVKAKTRLP